MPSLEHDGVVELFRDNPHLGPHVLERFWHASIPHYTEVRVADAQMTELSPVEFRADLVLELVNEAGTCVSAIVLESQLEITPRKRFTWPAYLAVCRAERECPTGLLVVAVDEAVAAWATESIDLGFGASEIRPYVLGPTVLPKITDEAEAREDPELSVLSAMAHGNGPEGLAVVLASLTALGGLQRDLAAVYFEVIWKGLRGPMQKALEALLMQRQMRREVKFPPFIERLIEESALKGFHDGEVKMLRHDIVRVAQRRGLALTTEQQTRIGTCEDRALLDRWFDNVLEAMNGEDVFR
jgi:hypothetical protein